ncbi:MAG TPA: ATP-binding protein, partial [Holophaga sp.]|nr:ATP-binding protein [Holophaga sp.]
PGALHLAVKDNGCGMNEEQLRTAFLPFSSGFQEGTGLGLSLVYQFVQRMNWDIWLASQVGRGTTAHLRIPAAP